MYVGKPDGNRLGALAYVLPIWALAAPVQAALSGYHDSLEQIQTMVSNPRVAEALKQLPIESIESTSDLAESKTRVWRVRSQICDLTLQLEANPPSGPGKTTYVVKQISACR